MHGTAIAEGRHAPVVVAARRTRIERGRNELAAPVDVRPTSVARQSPDDRFVPTVSCRTVRRAANVDSHLVSLYCAGESWSRP